MSKLWTQTLIGITLLGLFFGWIRHADAEAEQDAKLLLSVAKPFMQTNEHITFKYTGYFGSCGGVDTKIMAAGASLAQNLGFQAATSQEIPSQQGIYTVKSVVEAGASATLTVAGQAGQSACYAVLRLDASGNVERDRLLKWQEQMSAQLQDQGIQGMWTVMVQGSASEEITLQQSPKEFLAKLVHAYKGSVVESYEDATTFSVSLNSSEFQTSIRSGNQNVNLQLALHLDSTSGLWRLTAGTPIITMEY